MRREFEKVACPNCNRDVSAYIPHMGNGTALRLVKHNFAPHVTCSWSEMLIQYDSIKKCWKESL